MTAPTAADPAAELTRRSRRLSRRVAARGPKPVRAADIPAALDGLHLPVLLPGETVPAAMAEQDPFVFLPVGYEPDGTPVAPHLWPQRAAQLLSDMRLRRVALTRVHHHGLAVVSTVFLVIDSGGGGGRLPMLWETMIFRGGDHRLEGGCWRYASAGAAADGHRRVVAALRAGYAAQRVERRRRPAPQVAPWRAAYGLRHGYAP